MGVEQPLFLHEDVLPAIPSGWVWSRSDSVVIQRKPGKLFDTNTVAATGAVPVLNQSESGVLGYHDEEPGVVASAVAPVVTFANHTCAMRLVKHPFSAIQNIFPKVGKQGVCDTVWFYYALLGRVRTNEYKGHHPLFRDAFVPVPPLAVQRRIASILSTYDDLIENNTRRIAILEEMARRIYEEWFVRFRFPGHEGVRMVESDLGLVPEGWTCSDVARAVQRFGTGQKYDLKTVMSAGRVPVLDQGRQGVIGYHNDEPGFVASRADPVIVFANHTCYQRLIYEPFSTIQNVIPYKSSSAFQRDLYWVYHATLGLVSLTEYKGHWPQFEAKKIMVPTVRVTLAFGQIVRPLHELAYTLAFANANLRTTRDLLLPKLISGELQVSAVPEQEALAA